MKLFYYCPTGKYAALLAGAYRLRKLDKNASYQKFLTYLKNEKVHAYEPYFLGLDELGTEIYVISINKEKELVATIVRSFVETFLRKNEEVKIINCLPKPNFFLLVVLKLNLIGIFNFLTQKILPYAIWTNREQIYHKAVETR